MQPTPAERCCSIFAPARGTTTCSRFFECAAPEHFGVALPARGIAGDQQAALIGQACFRSGMAESTYGTGGFILLNTGKQAIASRHKLLTTIAYQWKGERTYALEGSIFSAGATVQWLRDGLGIVANAAETGVLAANADPDRRVYLVPAFTGSGPRIGTVKRARPFLAPRASRRVRKLRAGRWKASRFKHGI
jgi:glycerol kinase